MRKYLIAIFFSVTLFTISTNNSNITFAWICAENPEPKEALKTFDVVFSGKVIELKEEKIKFPNAVEYKSVISFEVINTWQGINQSQVKIVGMPDLLEFEKGKEYLVYAYTQKEDKNIWKTNDVVTSVCSRTVELSKADYDLQQLGQGQKPTEQVKLVNSNVKTIAISFFVLLIVFAVYRIIKRRKPTSENEK